jgi:hypothetical protein
MTETVKTLIYAGVAIVLGAVALWVNLPPRDVVTTESEVLYADFTDSKDAARLEIVRVDEAQGKLDRFEVERMQGRWVIPSHGNYPADAQAQMTDAATSLINLPITPATRSCMAWSNRPKAAWKLATKALACWSPFKTPKAKTSRV